MTVSLPDAVRRLTWDSDFFGFPVASCNVGNLDDRQLCKALERSRRFGVRLIYVMSAPERPISNVVLQQYCGRLVDRKVTYVCDLPAIEHLLVTGRASTIDEYRVGPPSASMLALAEVAGQHSRFKADLRISERDFQRLYHTWIHKSTTRQIADVVLVATDTESPARQIGMVTLRIEETAGIIGLMAVTPAAQGRGIGRGLVYAAQNWLAQHDIQRITVVTQLDNHRACGLYERTGFSQSEVHHVYHFYPESGALSEAA